MKEANESDKYWTVIMTFLKIFKFKQGKQRMKQTYRTNWTLRGDYRLHLRRIWNIAQAQIRKHI